MLRSVALLCLLASGVAHAGSLPSIHKKVGDYVTNRGQDYETSLLPSKACINGGKQISITFRHNVGLVVRDYETANILAEKSWPAGGVFGTAIIDDDCVVHVFGTLGWGANGGSIIRSTLSADFTPSPPATIYTASSSVMIANLSIVKGPSSYLMSIENAPSSISFLTAPSIEGPWSKLGPDYAPGGYVGSPKLYYQPALSAYFLTYLAHTGAAFHTITAKSTDLVTFSTSPGSLLWPDFPYEGNNASDLVMAPDAAGNTRMIYADGDQVSWWNLRAAAFFGSLDSLFGSMSFPSSIIGAGVSYTASSDFGGVFPAWQAGDKNSATFWHSASQAGAPQNVDVALPVASKVTAYSILPRAGFPTQAPASWVLRGSMDGVSWTDVAFQSGITFAEGTRRFFAVQSPGTFSRYRLQITGGGASGNISIAEFDLLN